MSFTPRGDVHPRRHSGTESFWAAISEALRKEGIVPGYTAPQAGSRCYWPCTTCLGHHQVTQHPSPPPLLKGLSSQAHLVLYIRFLGTCMSESVGEVVPSADSGPTQPCWSGSEDAGISRKFPASLLTGQSSRVSSGGWKTEGSFHPKSSLGLNCQVDLLP